MVSFGKGMIKFQGEKTENLFYKEGIEKITLDCGKWIRNQIVDLAKPISDVRELWQTPKATPEATSNT